MEELAINFSVRLTEDQRNFLDAKARREGRRSAGNALRKIVEDAIEKEKVDARD